MGDVTREQSAQKLNEMLANAVNMAEGTISGAANPNTSITFSYKNPITGERKTERGIALTPCSPSTVFVFQVDSGEWFVVGKGYEQQTRQHITELRHGAPQTQTDEFLVGLLYKKQINDDRPAACPKDPDAPEELPPPDPKHPRPNKKYGKIWVNPITFTYPQLLPDIETWLFSRTNCGLNASATAASTSWLPSQYFPNYGEEDVSAFLNSWSTFDHVLYEAPNFDAKIWYNWQQDFALGSFTNLYGFFSLSGLASFFDGNSAPDAPPGQLWLFTSGIWQAINVPLTYGQGYGFTPLSNQAAGACAPRLPAPPEPPDPDPNDPHSYEIYLATNKAKTPVKLTTLSGKDAIGKGDVLLLPKKTVVILKYGKAKNDGAPNTIDRGYCRVCVFEVLSDGTFTEYSYTWQDQIAFRQKLNDLELEENRFLAVLSSFSFYADDSIGFLEGQINPLYEKFIDDGSLDQNLFYFCSRHFRNMNQMDRVFVIDPSPIKRKSPLFESSPPFTYFFEESVYTDPEIQKLKTGEFAKVRLRCLQAGTNNNFNSAQPETSTNPRRALSEVVKNLNKDFKIKGIKPQDLQAVLMTLICVPVKSQSYR